MDIYSQLNISEAEHAGKLPDSVKASERLEDKGFNRSGRAIQVKFNAMKTSYRAIHRNNNSTGAQPYYTLDLAEKSRVLAGVGAKPLDEQVYKVLNTFLPKDASVIVGITRSQGVQPGAASDDEEGSSKEVGSSMPRGKLRRVGPSRSESRMDAWESKSEGRQLAVEGMTAAMAAGASGLAEHSRRLSSSIEAMANAMQPAKDTSWAGNRDSWHLITHLPIDTPGQAIDIGHLIPFLIDLLKRLEAWPPSEAVKEAIEAAQPTEKSVIMACMRALSP